MCKKGQYTFVNQKSRFEGFSAGKKVFLATSPESIYFIISHYIIIHSIYLAIYQSQKSFK